MPKFYRLILSATLLFAALQLAPAPAAADAEIGRGKLNRVGELRRKIKRDKVERKKQLLRRKKGQLVAVPELDPTAAGSALLLLAGGVLILGDRRRRIDLSA